MAPTQPFPPMHRTIRLDAFLRRLVNSCILLLGLAFGLAYTRNRRLTAAIAVAMTGAIEILQIWAPGRHARLEDFVVDALAACAGFAVAAGLDWVVQRSSASMS